MLGNVTPAAAEERGRCGAVVGPRDRATLFCATAETGLNATFDNGNVDPLRVGLAGVGGAGGELVGTGLSALFHRVTPGLRNMLGQGMDDAAQVLSQWGSSPPGR
jgi:hypothetical protein